MTTFDAYTGDAGTTITKTVTAAGASVGDLTGAVFTARVTNPSGVVETWASGWTGLTGSRVQFVTPTAAYWDEVGTWEWRIQYTLGGVTQTLDPLTLEVGIGGAVSGSVPAAATTLTRTAGAANTPLLTLADANAATGRTVALLQVTDSNDGAGSGVRINRTSPDGQSPPLLLQNVTNDLNGDVLVASLDGGVVTPLLRLNQTAGVINEVIWGTVGKANAHYGNISILRNTLVENDQPFFRLVPAWTLGGTNIDMKGESDGANYDRWRLLFGRDTDRTLQVTCPDATPGYVRLGKLGLDMHPDQTYTRALFRLRYDVDEVMEIKRHENYSGSGLYHSSAAFTSTLTTNQTAWYLPINTGRAFLVTARVVARKSDGTARAAYVLHCAVHGEGAGAVITAQSAALTAESDGTWGCAFTTSGDNLVLSVHGNNAIAETVYWVVGLEYHSVASAA